MDRFANWIQGFPEGVFLFAWAMVALLAGVMLYAAVSARLKARAIASATPVDVSDLTAGYGLAWGRVTGPRLKAPLTGRPCAWWRAEVWESVREVDVDKKYRHVWREVMSRESDKPILFGDGKQVCGVYPFGADITPTDWSDWRGERNPPENRAPDRHPGTEAPPSSLRDDIQGTFGPKFRYVERYIGHDDPIFALGEASLPPRRVSGKNSARSKGIEDDDLESGDPDDDELELADDPSGIVNPAAPYVHGADWVIFKAKGKPFVISTRAPEDIGGEAELASKAGIWMSGFFLALFVVIGWARFFF